MIVGVVGNQRYRELPDLLQRLTAASRRLGFSLVVEERLVEMWPPPAPPRLDSSPPDCLVTFGGDGTLLRGVRLLKGAPVPVLGVNLGRIGFLTTAGPDNLEAALEALARGRHATEQRKTLRTAVVDRREPALDDEFALNDVVLHKGGAARVLGLRVTVDGQTVGQYSADGIIVATPTGSTAYALSAGGPILLPGVDGLVIAAICPHSLAIRPIVVRSEAQISIEPVPPWTDEVLVSVDGQLSATILPGERIVVERAPHPVLLVRLGEENFFMRMRKKLQWGDLVDREERDGS